MNIIYRTRILLIQVGKVLPFFVCLIAAISYTESCVSLLTDNYIIYDGDVILNKPLSFFLGNYFEYNIQMLVVLFVISIAIETCYWNKLACLYLGINLLEKSYFDFEMEVWLISVICTLNIIASGFLVYKGVVILLRNR